MPFASTRKIRIQKILRNDFFRRELRITAERRNRGFRRRGRRGRRGKKRGPRERFFQNKGGAMEGAHASGSPVVLCALCVLCVKDRGYALPRLRSSSSEFASKSPLFSNFVIND